MNLILDHSKVKVELDPPIKHWIAYRGLDPDSLTCEKVWAYWDYDIHAQLRVCTAGVEVALLDYALMGRIDPQRRDRSIADEIVYGAMIELRRLLIGKNHMLLLDSVGEPEQEKQ